MNHTRSHLKLLGRSAYSAVTGSLVCSTVDSALTALWLWIVCKGITGGAGAAGYRQPSCHNAYYWALAAIRISGELLLVGLVPT
jgi:hypothetical protein